MQDHYVQLVPYSAILFDPSSFTYLIVSVRMILFCIVWGITFGKHHFWFLPNLTEDVGFFDSFKPLYKHDIMDDKTKSDDSKDEDKKDKDTPESKSGSKEKTNEKDNDNEDNKNKSEQDEEDKEQESATGSEMDNDNGYEIVDPEEVPEKDEDQEVEGETKKTK